MEEKRIDIVKEINRLEWLIKPGNKDGDYDQKLEKAKGVSIKNFIEFNRAGFAKCLWHNEKTPSMKYYPKQNKVYCFSCNSGGDVIDVVRKIKNISIKEAINIGDYPLTTGN